MIALGCDHGGYELKQEIIKYLKEHNLNTRISDVTVWILQIIRSMRSV